MLSSWFGGFGPGIVASILTILVIKFFFTPPFQSLAFTLRETPRFVVFLFAGGFISWLGDRQRRTAGIRAVLIFIDAAAGFLPRLRQRSEAQNDVAALTATTQLQVDNSQGRIRIGSYAQVRFASVAAAPALTLPSSVLLFRAQGLQVGVVNAQGLVELRNVELGRDSASAWKSFMASRPPIE